MALGYDLNTEELIAQFSTGSYYRYSGVPADVVLQVLFDPDSQGKAFNDKIKSGAYPYERIENPEEVDLHV